MSASTNTLIKKAKAAREAGSDTFADCIVSLRKADAHKSAGYKAERPFYADTFGIADRSLSDWTHAGRIRAALTADGVDLSKQGDAGVTAYAGVTADKAAAIRKSLGEGMTLKQALHTAAGHNSAVFADPDKTFAVTLGDSLPPAFEALALAVATLGLGTSLETLKEGELALWQSYEALGLILAAIQSDVDLAARADEILAQQTD